MEDYAWAIEQVRLGQTCRRVNFRFSYQRQANPRELIFTACAFRLAARHALRLRWLGRKQTLSALGFCGNALSAFRPPRPQSCGCTARACLPPFSGASSTLKWINRKRQGLPKRNH